MTQASWESLDSDVHATLTDASDRQWQSEHCHCKRESDWLPLLQAELLSLPSDLAMAQDWPIIGLFAPAVLRISSP